MDYRLTVSALRPGGAAIPLTGVAEAMASHEACGYGKFEFHEPTFFAALPNYRLTLLRAALDKSLSTCGFHGIEAAAETLISTRLTPDEWWRGDTVLRDLSTLHVMPHALNKWAETCGHVFHIELSADGVVCFDGRNESGETVIPGHYIGVVEVGGKFLTDRVATPLPEDSSNVEGKKWTPKKLDELAAYRKTHTMPETAAQFRISEQRIRQLLPRKKAKATPFGGLIHRAK